MRIRQIRFKNLNSLIGGWEIDLTHPAFSADGLFAITGPTGAGKSTILDAICLALYGRTPRLSKVTKSSNDILSRQTGDCFAEVSFETQQGQYRCHWSQHRSRKRADGELQAPKHELADTQSGQVLASSLRGVAEQIETLTGMDFDRFTRSMLLAQGGFDTFLKAEVDQRAPILEQITGTEIYSQISIHVHERQREERERLSLLQAETAGIRLLEPSQEAEIQQSLEDGQRQETELTRQIGETQKAIDWLNQIEALKEEIANLSEEAKVLKADKAAFETDRAKLSRAEQTATLDGLYAQLLTVRQQQTDEQKAVQTEEASLPKLEAAVAAGKTSLAMAEQQHVRAKEALSLAGPDLRQVRALDQRLADLSQTLAEAKETVDAAAEKRRIYQAAERQQQEDRRQAEAKLAQADAYLKQHARDEALIAELAAVEIQLKGLVDSQQEIRHQEQIQADAETALAQARALVESCQAACALQQQNLGDASAAVQQEREALSQLLGERLLREYRAEKEGLLRELSLQARITELESHRARLEDGQPCPLCGAIEHPYATGNVPVPDSIEQRIEALSRLIDQAEQQEVSIQAREAKENLAREDLVAAENRVATALNGQQLAEQTLAERTQALETATAVFKRRAESAAAKLRPLGVTDLSGVDFASVLESLKLRRQSWLDQSREKANIEKQLATIDSDLKALAVQIQTQSDTLVDWQRRQERQTKDLASGREQRTALYGYQNPDQEERRLNQLIVEAEAAERTAREQQQEGLKCWERAKTRLETLSQSIRQRAPELKQLETAFEKALAAIQFTTEAAFLAARLTLAEKSALVAAARLLDERQTTLNARQQDREQRLARERERKLSDQPLSELQPQYQTQQETLNDLRERIAQHKHQLNEHQTAKVRIQEKQAAIEAQQNVCRPWENLHALIGSADGKKFRNFAQGLTFELMVAQANRQLQKMSDRYLLVRDEEAPLELNVIDNYQAGEIRSTKNLSGGESFIVSLSLALGLSRLSSKNVRVDSLFLDEGFGTLDDDALDTALETLAGLQQDGKLIGVISHVLALKERISTQIKVSPQTGGRSQISGPGCRQAG